MVVAPGEVRLKAKLFEVGEEGIVGDGGGGSCFGLRFLRGRPGGNGSSSVAEHLDIAALLFDGELFTSKDAAARFVEGID